MRGIIGGALTLIILQAFSTGKGPDQAGKLIQWVNLGLTKAMSPDVAAIPTRKTAPPSKAPAAPSTGGIDLPRNPSVGTVQV
jgi:hypothetical protein